MKEEQIWGDKALPVMKGYGTKTGMSDLAIALGGLMGSDYKTSDGHRTGYLWSASSDGIGYVRTVRYDGVRSSCVPCKRLGGARPALPSSITSSIKPREARLSRKIGDIEVMEYGEYPQTIAKPDAAKELDGLSTDQLEKIKTGKKYTFDDEKSDAYDKPFKAKEYDEYQHNGKRYIRIEARPYDSDSVLSNDHRAQRGEKYWIEVQPIEWLKDPSDVWVARQALFSGVQFDRNREYDGNFAKTDMKQYLDTYFSKEMLAGVDKHAEINEEQKPKSAPPTRPIEINPTDESSARAMLARFGDKITRADLLKVGKDKRTMLRKVIEGGLIGDALKMLKAAGEKITSDDLIAREPGAANSNIEQIAAQGQLAAVFQPENWTNNVREMQEVWARVPKHHQAQLDGQEGRVSFRKLLHGANATSLKTLQATTGAIRG